MQKRDVVKFNGQPVEIELAYATGKEGQNEHGPYYTYGLAGDKVMFATPALNQAIQNLKPAKGARLSIHLAEGNRWEVKLHPPAEQPKTPTPPAARQTAPPDATTRNDSPITSHNHSANGNGHAEMPTQVQYGHAFADFLILAADAVRMAEKNSPAGSVRFDNRDVAAIATTMWIAADKSGFLTWNGTAQGGR